MKYILILKNGKVMTFNVLECATLYQTIYGGTLITELIQDSITLTQKV